MAITVVCPGCMKRFNVSDKFAGKKGPCPKCKAEITIPAKSDEVKVHEPTSFGPKDAKGRATLKPIFREEVKVTPVMWGAIGGSVLLFLVLALVSRATVFASLPDVGVAPETSILVSLGIGAVLLAPPLAYAGYTFMRDDELAPFRGKSLWIRVTICGIGYAVLWVAVVIPHGYLYEWEGLPIPALMVVVALMLGCGAGIAVAALDFDFFTGLIHYGLYFLSSLLLRLIAGVGALPLE